MYVLIAKAIRISHAKFHCSRLTTLQDIQDYANLIILAHSVLIATYRSIEVSGAGAATVAVVVPSGAVSDADTLDPDAGALIMVESGESSLSSGQLNDSFSFV